MNKTSFNPIFDLYHIDYTSKLFEYKEQMDYNHYSLTIEGKETQCFMKTIPLVDYIKLLIGKYKKYDICVLPSKERNINNIYEEYIHSIHNYAYVDNFFYILSNKLNINNYKHGIEVYDSFITMKENCEINIADDFEYLCDSNYFNEHLNKLFHFKDNQIHSLFSNLKKPPIELGDILCEIECDTLEDEQEPNEEIDHTIEDDSMNLIHKSLGNVEQASDDDDSSDESSKDSEDDDENVSRDESSKDSEDDDDSFDDTTTDTSSENSFMDELTLIIKKIPTQNILLEKCVDTLDSLFEKDKINVEELTSAMFQTIVILYLYQNVFEFTHNDLHTNNIMFVETKEEFLYYKIKNIYYKVPTYGKIYKLIDFGRAIYTYKNTRLCSDSFSPNGTAHGQYNCEPFLNSNKNTIEPNYSFDLCRLACSMFDFIIDSLDDIDVFRKIPLYDMIIEWIHDDSGNNVMYKKNGDERYPDFKLYKMIARNVNKHVPEKQFDHACFKDYITHPLDEYVNIDELIKMKDRL